MSGFAFQKLNGKSTTAFKQLDELIKLNEISESILEATSKPEVWKQAKMLFPDNELIPINWHWQDQTSSDKDLKVFNDGKKYYGTLSIALNIDNPRKKQGTHKANLFLSNDGKEVMSFQSGFKGKHDWNIETGYYVYSGIFDQLTLKKWHSHKYTAEVGVYFVGFEIGVSSEFTPPIGDDDDVDIVAFVIDKADGWLQAVSFYENGLHEYKALLNDGSNEIEKDIVTHIYHENSEFVIKIDGYDDVIAYRQPSGPYVAKIPSDVLSKNITIDFNVSKISITELFINSSISPHPQGLGIQLAAIDKDGDVLKATDYAAIKKYYGNDINFLNQEITKGIRMRITGVPNINDYEVYINNELVPSNTDVIAYFENVDTVEFELRKK